MRIEGLLKTWNDERGFGFIQPLSGGQEFFVHIKAFPAGVIRPVPNLKVSFEVEATSDGKKRAKNVQLLSTPKRASNPAFYPISRWSKSSVFVLCSFALLVIAVYFLLRPHAIWALTYLFGSLLCFMLYLHDKNAAEAGEWRISEVSLLMAGLVGGWPGALITQQLVRHKTSKLEFRVAFWATVILNVLGFLLMTTPLGQTN